MTAVMVDMDAGFDDGLHCYDIYAERSAAELGLPGMVREQTISVARIVPDSAK